MFIHESNCRHYEDSKLEETGEAKTKKKKKSFCNLLLFVVVFPYTLR